MPYQTWEYERRYTEYMLRHTKPYGTPGSNSTSYNAMMDGLRQVSNVLYLYSHYDSLELAVEELQLKAQQIRSDRWPSANSCNLVAMVIEAVIGEIQQNVPPDGPDPVFSFLTDTP